jgi:hypothetical protein
VRHDPAGQAPQAPLDEGPVAVAAPRLSTVPRPAASAIPPVPTHSM